MVIVAESSPFWKVSIVGNTPIEEYCIKIKSPVPLGILAPPPLRVI